MHQKRPFLTRKGDDGFNPKQIPASKGDGGFKPPRHLTCSTHTQRPWAATRPDQHTFACNSPHAHFTPRHTIVEIPGYSQSNEPQAPNHPSARQAPQVWRAPEARLRRPWAAAGPGQATHRHPRPIGSRREACGAWPGFETTHRAKLAARTASGRAGRRPRAQQAARPHAAPHAHGAPAPHANGWGASRHPTHQRPSFNKRSLCRQRLGGADLGGPAAGQPRRDQRGHDGHDAHADQL